jgi:hypothetical protein
VHNLLQLGREQANSKDPEHHNRILKWQEKLLETATPYKPVIIGDNEIDLVFEKVLADVGNK